MQDRPPQCSPAVLMVRPARFCANPQTADSNAFQTRDLIGPAVAEAAVREFGSLAGALREAGVQVVVLQGREDPDTPDQLFPNNWLSLHADGTAVLYPMAAENRRLERRLDALDTLAAHGFRLRRLIDLRAYETAGRYLEGTGSLVLDHRERIAYACRSSRTDLEVAHDLCRRLGLRLEAFDATDASGRPVYHTNVVMSLGERFAAVCLEAVADAGQRNRLCHRLRTSGRELLALTMQQMRCFAGNMLQLACAEGERLIVLSAAARESLHAEQLQQLTRHGRLLSVAMPTIEAAGGGSVRCMLAEIFLPRERDQAHG